MPKHDILVVGSLNADLVASVERFPNAGETVAGRTFSTFCGGKGANQAVAAARLGANVAMIGAVGNDEFGRSQVQNLSSSGVNTDAIHTLNDLPTGTALIEVDAEGQNRIVVVPGANGAVSSEMIDDHVDLLRTAKVVLIQLEIPLAAVVKAVECASANGVQVILDPAPVTELSLPLLQQIDYITPNLGELGELTNRALLENEPMDSIAAAARVLLERAVGNVIVKLGARGAILISKNSLHHWPGRDVEALDTTAAGDCFNGAFAAALLSGESAIEAGEFAVAASALSVTRRGAQAAMPILDEVQEFIDRK